MPGKNSTRNTAACPRPNWMAIENEKEKYAAYLCSREWAEKRERVRERARGRCERCLVFPMDACHHLTYERKYDEKLTDLQAICTRCHEFAHGKADDDPSSMDASAREYFFVLMLCSEQTPFPGFTHEYGELSPRFMETIKAIEILEAAQGSDGPWSPVEVLNDSLPFDYRLFLNWVSHKGTSSFEYSRALNYFGFQATVDSKWFGDKWESL